MTATRLVLWDIDHTLIETGGVGGEVFHTAFEAAIGRAMKRIADVSGRTEPDIFREALELHGIRDPGDYFDRFAEAQAAEYLKRADDMRSRGRALPGAAEALARVAETPGVIQSLLTGNTRPAAEAKLRIFALCDHIDFRPRRLWDRRSRTDRTGRCGAQPCIQTTRHPCRSLLHHPCR